MKLFGPVRATLAVVAGAGLVWGATQVGETADATRPADVHRLAGDTTSSTLDDVSLSCPGAQTAGTVQAASLPAVWLSGHRSGGSVRLVAHGTTPLTLHRGGVAGSELPAGSAGTVLGKGALATGLVATQTHLDDSSTARGLNVSVCGSPVQDGWYFGGGDAPGRVARLTLVNTGASATTVDATVVGSRGIDAGASVKGTVLAPGERKVLLLGDLGPSLSAPAIHLTATGGGVSASLTDAWMDGETPVGEDTTTTAVTPADKLLISGVSATGAAPEVRVVVPGKEEAIVRVRAVDATGAVKADTVQTVAAGTAAAMTLTGLEPGRYDVQVTADVPVAASVMSRTASSGPTDLTWSPALPATETPAGIALPARIPGGTAELMLCAPAATTADVVTVTGTGTHTQTVTVPADRPVVADVGGAAAVWVRPQHGGRVQASVTIGGRRGDADFLATVPLQATPLRQSTSRLVPARG